jgi:hypothetical protein
MGKSRVEVAAAMWPYITVVTNMFGDAQVHARLYTAQALHGESLRFTTGAAARGAAICLRESPCRDIFVTDLVLVNKNVELAGLHVRRSAFLLMIGGVSPQSFAETLASLLLCPPPTD